VLTAAVEESVEVNGVQLYVRRYGDPALPVLVVIHGGPTWDHSYLLPAVAQLAGLRHVVLFDLRGCGRSARTPPVGETPVAALQPDLLADDVAALLDRYAGGRGDLLGFSYGGMVAMRVVDQHPEQVDRLVLASTTAYRGYAEELSALPDRRERAAQVPGIRFDDPALTGPQAPDGALSRAMAQADTAYQIWRLDRRDEWAKVLDGVRFSSDWNGPFAAGTLRPAGPPDAEAVLRDWGRPVLILHGAREMSFPVALARRLHAALPASTLVEVPEAAHMAHFDNPDAWLAAIRTFLS
jgi:pimeloyl-ACP methyl ester carboxylesterase